MFGTESGKDDHLLTRPGDGNIETPFTAIAVHGAEVHRDPSRGIGAVADGEEDHIPLVSLDVFQVLDENGLNGSVGEVLFDLRILPACLLQQIVDKLLLGLAERDNAYAEPGLLRIE